MTIPVGQVSLSDVNVELGVAANTTISMNQANLRSLAGVASGAISMNDLRGKSAVWLGTISTPQQQMDLYTWATSQGYPGSGAAQITVAPNIYVWSDSTAAAGMSIPSSFAPGTLTLVNNGFIMGKGGGGGNASGPGAFPPRLEPANNGAVGGTAISINSAAVTLLNSASGWIGGGGGGGGGTNSPPSQITNGGGGGAGGGNGGNGGATGGAIGTAATMGSGSPTGTGAKPAGGGRGTRRFVLNEMAGGGGGYPTFPGFSTPVGGTNNGAGATGSSGNPQGGAPRVSAGGGGGWGASGGPGGLNGGFGGYGNGAAGGKAIALNGQTITQTNSGTIWGAIS